MNMKLLLYKAFILLILYTIFAACSKVIIPPTAVCDEKSGLNINPRTS